MNNWLAYLLDPYQTYTLSQIMVESIAALFGIVSVFFSLKRNIWVFPTGIISTFLYTFLLFNWGLYGETLINVYYTLMSIYGWLLWHKQTQVDRVHVHVNWSTKKDYFFTIILFLMSFFLVHLIYYFRPYLQGTGELPFTNQFNLVNNLDATTTSVFLIAMWLMAKRKVDSWLFWILGNVLAIGLFTYKGYGITAIQYVIFTILAVIAFFSWRNDARKAGQ